MANFHVEGKELQKKMGRGKGLERKEQPDQISLLSLSLFLPSTDPSPSLSLSLSFFPLPDRCYRISLPCRPQLVGSKGGGPSEDEEAGGGCNSSSAAQEEFPLVDLVIKRMKIGGMVEVYLQVCMRA